VATKPDDEACDAELVRRRLARDWPPGPWDEEPDAHDWVDAETGYKCYARRNDMGAWCGYVFVPHGHPVHGCMGDISVSVHGGVTYTKPEIDPDTGFAVPFGAWVVGFDCGHIWDIVPALQKPEPAMAFPDGEYRTLAFVVQECQALARQLYAAR
jgi:hypothetical protein